MDSQRYTPVATRILPIFPIIYIASLCWLICYEIAYAGEWVKYEDIYTAEKRVLTKQELSDKYPNIIVQGIKLNHDMNDNWYHFESGVRALFIRFPDGTTKFALTEKSENGKTIAVYNPIKQDWIRIKQSSVLVGKLAEYDENKYSLTIIGFGEFSIDNPEIDDNIVDLSDLKHFAGKSVITESVYVGDGKIRINSIKILDTLR